MTLRVYVRMAVVIFSLSIVAKLLSIALVPERLVAAHGMFTFLSIRQFLFFAAVLFTGYHAWMISKGVSGCGCFGIFPVKALNRALDYFTYGVLLFLLVGGGVVITRETLRANAPAKET